MTTLFDGIVQTSYGHFSLEWGDTIWDADVDRFFRDQLNGWVAAAVPEIVFIQLAEWLGGRVTIVSSEAAPPLDDEWEDAVEVSFTVPSGAEVRWSGWAGETGGPLELDAGGYRLRVNARGRDVAQRGGPDMPDEPDAYLLQIWPQPPGPDAILRAGSADSQYWNREWGGRRER